jgi:hypothetical protein
MDLVEEVVKDVEDVEDGLDCELEGVGEGVGVDPELEDGDVVDAMAFSEVTCCSAGGRVNSELRISLDTRQE